MLIVEVGFKLNRDLEYYDNLLKQNGLKNDFNCETHDIYYTKENLIGLTENEMKQKCIRLRHVNFKVDEVLFNNDEYNNLELELIKVLEEKSISYYQKCLHI